MFIIYMNDIANDIFGDILIFADDIYSMASGNDPAETVQQLETVLVRKWKVLFNAKKS
jgi:hypothetical protein